MEHFVETLSTHMIVASLLIGWILDIIFGDPTTLPHPIVYMGKWVAWGENKLNTGKQKKFKGALFSIATIVMVYVLAWSILHLLGSIQSCSEEPWSMVMLLFRLAIMSAAVFFCLAGKTLRSEVRMVFEALDRGLDEGRRQVARIVGRDTQSLSRQEVATAALETLAENLSDGVIAPLFWYALLGVPGMLTYKMINTFDSMIGYKTARFKDFGCWAAHIDDIANYIPARITAILIAITGWAYAKIAKASIAKRSLPRCLRHTFHYSRCHASPNSGWPEAALSAILDCRFGGPHDYFGELFYKPYIGSNPRKITTKDMSISIRVCLYAEIISIFTITIICLS